MMSKKDEVNKKKIDIECIEGGMLAAADVYNQYGTIILRKNRTIQGKHIVQMRLAGIREIEVIAPEKSAPARKIHIRDYPRHAEVLRNARIMIVDDSRSALMVIKGLVEEAGLKVIGMAMTTSEAIERAAKLKPTCVTLDLSMPDADGAQAIKPMMAALPGVKIVVVSSLGYEDRIVESLELGAVQFVSKPFDGEDFKKILINSIIS